MRLAPLLIIVACTNEATEDVASVDQAVGDDEASLRAELASYTPAKGPPLLATLTKTKIATKQFFEHYAALYGLGPDDEMVEVAPGRYQQRHQGVTVESGEVLLTARDGFVRSALGHTVAGLAIDPSPAIDAVKAAAAARAAVAARRRVDPDGLVLHTPPAATLVIHDRALAYRIVVVEQQPLGSWEVHIDARTGEALELHSLVRTAWEPVDATGDSLYNGPVDFFAQMETTTLQCRLRSIFGDTFGLGGSTNLGDAADIVDSDCVFSDQLAVSVHWALQQTWTYFYVAFDRAGYDGNESGTNAFVHTGFPGWAYWEPQTDTLLVGNEVPEAGSLDHIGHEFTHALADEAIKNPPFEGLNPTGESGALEEGFADIFGTMVEHNSPGVVGDWVFGGDLSPLIARLLDAPNLSLPPQPDTYGGTYWATDPNVDSGGIHTNNGVLAYWFYLLAAGGVGINDLGNAYVVKPVGETMAARIAYETLTKKLVHWSNFELARLGSLEATKGLCGEGSIAEHHVADAWYAVGLGNGPIALAREPHDGSLDVDPWTFKLKWEVSNDTGMWDYEIATDPAFGNIVAQGQTPYTEYDLATIWAYATPNLEPSTTYYWRVRQTPGDFTDESCWRTTASFTTKQKTSTPISPTNGHDVYHPWDLEFTWSEVDGAHDYDVEVYDTNNCAPGSVIATANVLYHNMTKLDVRVDDEQSWRVRPNNTTPGSWSTCQSFVTKLPEVVRTSPADLSSPFPWHVTLQWQPIVGAETYHVYLTHNREGFTAGAEVEVFDVAAPSTSKTIDLIPVMTYHGDKIWWRVGVTGPAPLSEAGKDSTSGYFNNNGDATIPVAIGPMTGSDPPYIHYGHDVTVTWQHVPYAEAYELTLYRFMGGASDQYFVEYDNVIFGTTLPRDDSDPNRQSFTIAAASASMPPSGNGGTFDQYGFAYSIKAIGPGALESPDEHSNAVGAPSMNWGDGVYYLIPPPVTAQGESFVYTSSNHVLYAHGGNARYIELLATQDPKWSPTGHWAFKLYNGWGCDESWLFDARTEPNPWTSTWFYEDWSKKGSYRAKLVDDYQPFSIWNSWSACFDFEMASEAEQRKHDDPPKPPPADIPQVKCGEAIQHGFNESAQYVVMIDKPVGDLVVHYDTQNVPDNIHVYHDGNQLMQSGCVSGASSMAQHYDGNADWVLVEVEAECSGSGNDTVWYVLVDCP